MHVGAGASQGFWNLLLIERQIKDKDIQQTIYHNLGLV